MTWWTEFREWSSHRKWERADQTARRLRRKNMLARVGYSGSRWYVMVSRPRQRRAQRRWL